MLVCVGLEITVWTILGRALSPWSYWSSFLPLWMRVCFCAVNILLWWIVARVTWLSVGVGILFFVVDRCTVSSWLCLMRFVITISCVPANFQSVCVCYRACWHDFLCLCFRDCGKSFVVSWYYEVSDKACILVGVVIAAHECTFDVVNMGDLFFRTTFDRRVCSCTVLFVITMFSFFTWKSANNFSFNMHRVHFGQFPNVRIYSCGPTYLHHKQYTGCQYLSSCQCNGYQSNLSTHTLHNFYCVHPSPGEILVVLAECLFVVVGDEGFEWFNALLRTCVQRWSIFPPSW